MKSITVIFSGEKKDVDMVSHEINGQADDLHVDMILDFTKVGYVNSMDLGSLISLRKRLVAAGGSLAIINADEHVFEIFDITHLVGLLNVSKPAFETLGLRHPT